MKNMRFLPLAALLLIITVGCKSKSSSGIPEIDPPGGIQPLESSDYGYSDESNSDSVASAVAAYGPPPAAPVPGPAASPAPQPVTPAAAMTYASGSRTHIVNRGDTLWSIARRNYGSGRMWHQIADANPGVDPHRLRIGQRLVVP